MRRLFLIGALLTVVIASAALVAAADPCDACDVVAQSSGDADVPDAGSPPAIAEAMPRVGISTDQLRKIAGLDAAPLYAADLARVRRWGS